MSSGMDGTVQAGTNAKLARFGWLDAWGLLFNVPRNNNEADVNYLRRIIYEVNAGAGPPVAIAKWLLNVWNIQATIQESLPTVGYVIDFSTALSAAQILAVLQSLVRIRPAGVPFVVSSVSLGLYLNTIDFLNGINVTGTYLSESPPGTTAGLGPATNNTAPSLPGLFLTDPTLNPSLAAA